MEKEEKNVPKWDEISKDFEFDKYYKPQGEWIVMANPQNEPTESGLYLPFSGESDRSMVSALVVAVGDKTSRIKKGDRVILSPTGGVYTMEAFGLKWDMCEERTVAGIVTEDYNEMNKLMGESAKEKQREHLAPKTNLSNLNGSDLTTIN